MILKSLHLFARTFLNIFKETLKIKIESTFNFCLRLQINIAFDECLHPAKKTKWQEMISIIIVYQIMETLWDQSPLLKCQVFDQYQVTICKSAFSKHREGSFPTCIVIYNTAYIYLFGAYPSPINLTAIIFVHKKIVL